MKDGDVFKIPLGDGRAAVGQIVSEHLSEYYVVIFDFVAPEEEVPSRVTEALESEPLFSGLSLDALFRPGRWQVLENRPVDGRNFLPAYRIVIGGPGNVMAENFRATRRRPATDLEKEILPFRDTFSAAIFERAMRAHVGLEPWRDVFDELRVGRYVKSADLFDD
ncbi:Imm26 family immunity protein [Arthrobacter zhaoxinii]|uniref:Imm26 family immunity protein n=1 Tax=Arthrobacter zhaoxinii TaxID=2964616 RepID=UPI002104D1FF|nr:Imm26 family immunity protein [Arthrobacter zhaoxinii]MCQ2001002.1 immunity 26/phosphotriesterase HocA family protein [Arthrobacter zhaoxinii]